MAKLCERLVEAALRVTVVVAGALLLHGAAQGENPNCANLMCKEISYFWYCNARNGIALQYKDCSWCKTVGRCDGGANVACNPSDDPQARTVTPVSAVCNCNFAPNVNAPIVEATGDYSGTYTPYGINRYLCPAVGG